MKCIVAYSAPLRLFVVRHDRDCHDSYCLAEWEAERYNHNQAKLNRRNAAE